MVTTSCGMCYGTCTVDAQVEDGVVVQIEGVADSPQGYGNICAKGIAGIMLLYDPNRVNYPLLRTNPEKGIGVDPMWKRISWDEALDIMTEKLRECMKRDPRGLYTVGSPTFPAERAFNILNFRRAFGTPNYYTGGGGLHCGNGAHMVAGIYHASWSLIPDYKYCNYAVYWGCSKGHGAGHAALVAMKQAADARARGMRLVVFDPFLSTQATAAEEWIPIKAGTDAAVALSMSNLLVNEYGHFDPWYLKWKSNGPYLVGPDGLYVRDSKTGVPLIWDPVANKALPFNGKNVKDFALTGKFEANGVRCTPSFQVLKDHLKKYTPQYASEVAGVPASTIRRVAKEFGEEARIGSTIKVEGNDLPLRPAASIYFRGAQGHYNQAWDCVSLDLMNHIVGSADMPGGALAFGPPVCMGYPETGRLQYTVVQDKDGLMVAKNWPYSHLPYPPPEPKDPPERLDLQDMFYIPTYTTIMLWDNNEEIWSKFKIPYRPDVMVSFATNQLMSVGNPTSVFDNFLKKFRFIISFNVYSTEFEEAAADLLLPDTCYLERLAVSTTFPTVGVSCHATGLGEWVWAIRQPAVAPMYERRPMVDVILEVSERLGLREKYIKASNEWIDRAYGGPLSKENEINPEEKLSFEKIMDNILKDRFGKDKGLAYFKEHGYIKWPKRVEEVYWRAFHDVRIPVYLEWIIRAGKKSRAVAEKYGVPDLVDWSAHNALPDWRPCRAHMVKEPEFDLQAFYWRSALHTYSMTMQNPWLGEISENDPYTYTIQLNPETAKRKNVKSGDLVWLENHKGHKTRGRLYLTEGIRPDHVAIAACAGHWAKGQPIAKGKGVFFNELIEVDKEHTCPLSLGQDICTRVKLYK
ncbi:MAG TPA: molybdopterin-dependent oxidoreductase [Thermoplasmata archaeon]